MSKVQALLENEEIINVLNENQVLVEAAVSELDGWYQQMTDFVLEHIEEFLDENIEETAKNVYTFSTFATSQYLSEISHRYGAQMHQSEVLKEAAKHEFV